MDKEALNTVKHPEEDFASLLEESLRSEEADYSLTEGVIVEIREGDEFALVDVGEKIEGKVLLSELRDGKGDLLYGIGDKIPVVIFGFRSERPIVSHKKALLAQKRKDFIASHKDEQDFVVEGMISKSNRGGFVVEMDGIEMFLPNSQALMKNDRSQIGKKIKAKILKIDPDKDSIIVSRKKYIDDERRKKQAVIDTLLNKEGAIEGEIKKITNYGMFVDVGGLEGLVHYNEISYKGPVNPAKHFKEGQMVGVKVIDYDKEKKRLSLSIKALHPDPWEEIKNELEVGDAIKVTVSNIEPYGAFVDLGNDIEGFLHISEISWDKKIKHPKDYLTMGQEIDVEVIEIDPKERRLRVSLKNLQPKPFEEFMQKHKAGEIVKGEVTSLTDFGAFVKIDKVEGLLHNQDFSWDKNQRCKDNLKVGDVVEVKIAKIDSEHEKISLNRKELTKSPVEVYAENHNIGQVVTGTVRDVKEFGIFVQLEDGVDALIRNEDIEASKKESLKVGDTLEGAITLLDAKSNKIRLSQKRVAKMRERDALKEISEGNEKMTLGDLIKEQLGKR